MHYLTRLKIILQSKIFYIILFLFIVFYVFINTIVIKYQTKIDNNIIEGIIININVSEDKASFILKTNEKVKCTYYFDGNNQIDYSSYLGKKVRIYGSKKELYNNTIPNTFNYKKYLYNNRIYLSFYVDSIEIMKDENIFYKIKNIIIQKINNYDNLTKTYLNLFILGNKDLLGENLYENYRMNGIWHLFAISGMHINLIILVLDKILKSIKLKKTIISGILFYFMFLTNFSASVQRTCIFYFLKNIFNYFNLEIDNKNILFITAFIILSINPFMIYNVGFQYSFLITLSIMLEEKNISGNYFKKIFKISLLSFMVSMPITINLNYEINILSIFLNIFYVPFISLLVFPLSILVFFIPSINCILNITINILEITNELFYNFKLCLIIPKMIPLVVSVYYFILLIYHHYPRKRYLLYLLILLLFNILFYKMNNNYYISFLDVGQGDSSIIITPKQKEIVMIDTGGIVNSNYNVSDNIILFLKSIGISRIDSLIISHGDYDHMGEAINLVENFKVEKVIFNCGEFNELEQDLIKVLDKKKKLHYSCIKELNVDDNKLYFLNNKDYGNENDNSSVIYSELDNHKFLFMGDASVDVEKDLLEKYNLNDIDILKIGHHGSKTSSSKEFVNKVNPEYSIISVGKNNRYGHPNDSVLDNLKKSNIYRTDEDGSITLKIKKDKLKIKTYSP